MSRGSGRSRNTREGPKPPTPAELQAEKQAASRTKQYQDALDAGTVPMERRGRSNAGQPQPISEEQFTARRVADMQGAAMTRDASNEFGYIDPNARRFDPLFQARQRPIRDDYGVQRGEFSDARVSNMIDPEQNYILTQEERAAMDPNAQFISDMDSSDGMPTDPFSSGLTDLQNQRKGLYEEMFANQEQFAQDKFDSIKDYLGTMDADRKQQYEADLANVGMMYNERRQQRDQRFNQALQGTGNRESLALDTLADLGITPNRETFDSVTGATKDMLFSQQQSGADLLNNMSFISNQMLEFTNSESGRAIAAGLQQAESSLAEEMANIQFARDSQAISDIEASIAQQKAEAQAAAALRRAQQAEELENQRAITAGAYFGVTDPAEAVALYRTGAMDDIIGAALAPTPQQEATIMVPSGGFGEIPMTISQAISAGYLDAPPGFGGSMPPQYFQDPTTGFQVPVESPSDLQRIAEIQALS